MANVRGTDADNPILIGSAGDTYLGGLGDDAYIIDPAFVASGDPIDIVDSDGNNVIRLVDGLTITSSQVSSDAAQLTLSNGTVIFIDGASSFNYEVGGDNTGSGSTTKSFRELVEQDLGTTVPSGGSINSGGTITIGSSSNGTSLPLLPSQGGPNEVDVGTASGDNINGDQDNQTLSGESGLDRFIFDEILNNQGEPQLQSVTIDDLTVGEQLFFEGGFSEGDLNFLNDGLTDSTATIQIRGTEITLTNLSNDQDASVVGVPAFEAEFGNQVIEFA